MDFDIELLITLATTIILAVFGWYIAHYFSSKREINAKRREMIVHYLITAWRKLENAAQKDELLKSEIESAIADIQLFGTNKQIELAHQASDRLAKEGGVNINNLLETL
jgi:hypothetical protein